MRKRHVRRDRWVLPNAIRVSICRRGRVAHLFYEEDFSNAAILKKVIPLLVACLPSSLVVTTRRGGKTARIVGNADYGLVASMIVGEFITWSGFAEMTVREALLGPMFRPEGRPK